MRRGLRTFRGHPGRHARPVRPPAGVGATTKRVLLSRRSLVGLALGGAGGYLIGQACANLHSSRGAPISGWCTTNGRPSPE